jgi:hypothetical protein
MQEKTPFPWEIFPRLAVVLGLVYMLVNGLINAYLLSKSKTFAKAYVSSLVGTRATSLEYIHPITGEICHCGGGRVNSSISKIGNMVIIRVHPYRPSVCRIDWDKTIAIPKSERIKAD